MRTNEPIPVTLALAALAVLLLAGCATPPATQADDGSSGAGASPSDDAADAAVDAPAGQASADQGASGEGSPSTTTGTTPAGSTTGSSGGRVTVNQAGSSTVLPIAEAWAEEYGRSIGARMVVGGGGSGAGINKFCRGELDIADASRAIRSTEVSACRSKGIEPFEIQVAIDGLSVVVNKDNDFAACLTVAQLNKVWTAVGSKQAGTWADLDPSWPDERIELFGPGTDSGTYDYWKEVIIHPFDGTAATTRSDYTPSEDDNVLVQGVANSRNALGFFGLYYAKENADVLNTVQVDGGDGCVEPTDENVASGSYSPLARPLFMYTDGKPEGVLQRYFERGLSAEGQVVVAEVGYIALPEASRLEMLDLVAS